MEMPRTFLLVLAVGLALLVLFLLTGDTPK
jgi:hypothetical protein